MPMTAAAIMRVSNI